MQLWGGGGGGCCSSDVISPPETTELCVDRGVLEHQEFMVHHTYPSFIRSRGQPPSKYSWSSDRPTHRISHSSSWHACRSYNRPATKDSRAVD
jgi:hypothetical protein